MKALLLLLFFTGIILILVNHMVSRQPTLIEYKYLPRDLDTFLREQTLASVEFGDLWAKEDPGPR